MEENGATKNLTVARSKIPKSVKLSSVEKKTVQSVKTTTKVPMTSSKVRETQVANLQKNVRRMTIARISKDVMNHFETENVRSDATFCTTRYAASSTVLDNENKTKRVPLKEKFTQNSQKSSGSLPKKQSADLKPCTASRDIRLPAGRKTYHKFDTFPKTKKASTNGCQKASPAEPCSDELKAIDSAKASVSKESEKSIEGSVKNPSTDGAGSSKAILSVEKRILKKYLAYGGVRFSPKWKSTPIRPDMLPNTKEESKEDEKILRLAAAKRLQKTPVSTKVIIKKKAEIATVDEVLHTQPQTKEPSSNTAKEADDKKYAASPEISLIPKRKGSQQKHHIFESVQKERKNGDKESHPSGNR